MNTHTISCVHTCAPASRCDFHTAVKHAHARTVQTHIPEGAEQYQLRILVYYGVYGTMQNELTLMVMALWAIVCTNKNSSSDWILVSCCQTLWHLLIKQIFSCVAVVFHESNCDTEEGERGRESVCVCVCVCVCARNAMKEH